MEGICNCGERLNDSVFLQQENTFLKSCPHCSEQAGHHVFYKQEHFGMRDMGDGRHIIQSWCSDCRAEQSASINAEYICENQ